MFKPFPKVAGYLGAVAVLFAALNDAAVLAVLPPKVAAAVAAIGSIVTLLSHSATGAGGKPAPWQNDPSA